MNGPFINSEMFKLQESEHCISGRTNAFRAALSAKESKRPGYPIRQEFMKPPARLDLGLMINVDADHSVKFDAQLVRASLCRRSFAFSGSSPARVVEVLGSICGVKT